MDSANLKAASSYLNNLLLARGLSRNGKPIEFARPSKGEGGTDATMAQIINLVHDLVLRRDREEEQRESFVLTLRTLRANEKQHTLEIDRLNIQVSDLHRNLALSQASERAVKSAVRAAETAARNLREEIARLKTMFAQVRSQCNNDVRKRDVQIQRLKSHLTSQQRGSRTGLVGASITITPGNNGAGRSGRECPGVTAREEVAPGLADPAYSLRQETTEFLTHLSQSLSDENDALIEIIRRTLETLREIGGITAKQQSLAGGGVGTEGDQKGQMELVQSLPTSYEELAGELNGVLEHLKTILTDPNFVSIEEVEVREDEIARLRDGWVKMEARWREAVAMMDGWRKRMLSGGDTVNLDELKAGLGLGVGLDSMSADGRPKDETADEEDLTEKIEDGSVDEVDTGQEAEQVDGQLPSPVREIKGSPATGPDLFDLKLGPPYPALKEISPNAKSVVKPRKVAFNGSSPTKHFTFADENSLFEQQQEDDETYLLPSSPSKPISVTSPPTNPTDNTFDLGSPLQANKRHSSAKSHPSEHSPQLTTKDKLDAVQAEADAVAALEEGSPCPLGSVSRAVREAKASMERSPVKAIRKTRIGGRARRRKSELTPEELERLMGL